jgi:hypothetical protein
MRIVNPRMATLVAAASVVLVFQAVPVRAQITGGTTRELGLKSNDASQGYAILKQIFGPDGRAELHVNLTPDSTIPPPEDWTWKIADSDASIKAGVNLTWYAQAACPDNLTDLRVSGPGGTLVQNPLFNPVSGYFQTQSFTVATVKDVCVNWANDHQCDILDPGNGCALNEIFDLVGGMGPSGPADRLRLRASCATGPVADVYYAPKLRLVCQRGQ